MADFHAYLAEQLARQIRDRRVVVWYDPRSEFRPFVEELLGGQSGPALAGEAVAPVQVGDQPVGLIGYAGSFYAVRAVVEPLVAAEEPEPLVIYLPAINRDPAHSPLLELEFAGTVYQPQLKRQARNFLRQFYTDGIIDELLASDKLSYADIATLGAQASNGGDQPAAVLRTIYQRPRDNATLIAGWLADPGHDAEIAEKGATGELYKLVGSRLGLTLDVGAPLAEARSRLLRYLLVGEFRADLRRPAPPSTTMIPAPAGKDQIAFMREVVTTLRESHADFYVETADRIEGELALATAGIAAADLGAIDTFRFEERAILASCDVLLSSGAYAEVLGIEAAHSESFWARRDVARQAQWRVCRLAAQLGEACAAVSRELERIGSGPTDWVAAYTRADGWYRLDQCQRQLESWVAGLDEEPAVRQGLDRVLEAHDRVSQRMATGFSRALREARWQVSGVRPQTRIYADFVAPRLASGGGPVAYFLVDAMRFEMGQELEAQLQGLGELANGVALAALPSITKIGMAALLPGAATGFNAGEEKGKLVASLDGTPLPDLPAREKLFKARVPQVMDLELNAVLTTGASKLARQIAGAPLIVVRSTDIDSLGENEAANLARRSMVTVIADVARAVRKLARAGVTSFVITADHGHLFSQERTAAMQPDTPNGQTVELHRRFWAGRGGNTPDNTLRVAGASLGYTTDLDFIFPTGLGVFRAGGDLAYHHGGLSLQELAVPVLTLRVARYTTQESSEATVIIGQVPDALHTRTMGITLTLTGNLWTSVTVVRPILLSGSEQVGYAGLAFGAELNQATGCITLLPGTTVQVAMLLTREDCASVRIVIQNPVTDAVISQTGEIPVELGIPG